MLFKLLVAVLALAFLVLGLAIWGSISSGPSTAGGNCESVSADFLDGIETGLTVQGGGSLGAASAVKSGDFESVWFVAAEINGSGMEGSGEVGVWATNSDPSGPVSGTIYAVNGFATEFSDWGEGATTDAGITMADDGAQEAESCVG